MEISVRATCQPLVDVFRCLGGDVVEYNIKQGAWLDAFGTKVKEGTKLLQPMLLD